MRIVATRPIKQVCWLSLLLLLSFSPAGAQHRIVFTPQWTAQAEFAGYYVAKENGFYREAGLDVEIVHPSLSQPVIDRVLKGECDATTLQLCQALEVIDKGVPLVNLLQPSMNDGTVIIAHPGKDPLAKGSRVGLSCMESGHLVKYLNKKENLNYQWITAAMPVNLFLAGAVDAISGVSYCEVFELMQAGIELNKDCVYSFADHGYNIQGEGLYVTFDYFRKHRHEAHNFAKATRRGWEWVAQHPDEAIEIVSKYIKADRIATNRELQRLMLKEVLNLQIDRKTGKREFLLRPAIVKQACRLMVESGLLSREIDYLELIER